MHFLIDAIVARSAAAVLRKLGHEATDVRDVGMRDAPDDTIAAYARDNHLVLVTRDFDFADIRNYAYLTEIEFRFNRRNKDDIFIDTLRHMITADPLTFENLTTERDPEFGKASAQTHSLSQQLLFRWLAVQYFYDFKTR